MLHHSNNFDNFVFLNFNILLLLLTLKGRPTTTITFFIMDSNSIILNEHNNYELIHSIVIRDPD